MICKFSVRPLRVIIYSYLMGVQAIDQNIFPEELEKRRKCSIVRGQRPRVIEHFGLSQYRGKNVDLLPAFPLNNCFIT